MGGCGCRWSSVASPIVIAPDLSVILLRSSLDHRRACLGAVQAQVSAAGSVEVFAVSGPADRGSEPDPRVRTVLDARDALRLARGRICVFLPGDAPAEPSVLRAHLQAHTEGASIVAVGRCEPSGGGRATRTLERSAARARQSRLDGSRPESGHLLEGSVSFARGDLVGEDHGSSPLDATALLSIGLRLEARGFKLLQLPDACRRRQERTFSQTAAGLAAEGAGHASACSHQPRLLDTLPIGQFNAANVREVLARRILLTLRVPVAVLSVADAVARRRGRASAWHDFVRRLCYWRGVRDTIAEPDRFRRLTRGVPILMYHAIGDHGEPASTYVLPAADFAAQMRWLDRRRRHVLSLGEYRRLRESHLLPPAGSVVITFDDGYADTQRLARPILREHGFPAEVFVVSQSVGDRNRWDAAGPLAGRAMLTWEDLDGLRREGFGIGAHTTNHVSLTTVPREEALAEVSGGRATLEQRLGMKVESFSYPNGRHDPSARAIVQQAGLRCACTSIRGVNDPGTPLLSLRRVEIRGHLALKSFAIAMWMGRPGLLRALREGA